MKKLIVVESPAKIKTISKFLDKDFKILSTMGHIKDLPTKEIGITTEDGALKISYVTLEGKEKTIADICKAAQGSNVIYLAPDPDREGEIIAWHIDQEIAKVIKKGTIVHRIAFNEITKKAVLEAIENPSVIDDQKVAAQQARRVLDRWVGYEVSPILWQKLAPGLSAGRVQSVALRIICDREDAIRIFKPEEYWTIEGNFLYQKDPFNAMLFHVGKEVVEVKNEEQATELVKQIKQESYIIESVTDKKRSKNPHAPFMTSTLQQAAYNRLGFSVKKTMQVAQKLYEGVPFSDPTTPVALITYMRTDSLRISDTALKEVRDYIPKAYSNEYLPKDIVTYEKKGKAKIQDAHEAIRPIDIAITPTMANKYLTDDAARLYTLIWQRFVACQMKPAEYAQRTVLIKGGKFTFKATGSTLLFDGFLKVYGVDDDDEDKENTVLPDLKAKTPATLKKVDPKQHFTQPPARYSEATLVKELEKEGIGRPSTYATILNTIRTRSYTTLEKKRFVPTELGMAVTKMLVENLPDIMDPKFTAHMEEDLDKISQGDLDRDKLLLTFHKAFQKQLKAFVNKYGGKTGKVVQPTELDCPSCKKNKLVILFGKTGEFLGCAGYPDCSFTSNFKRDEAGVIQLVTPEAPQLLEETCPKCGKQLRAIKGKFGEFIACSGYPECKYIKQNKANFACPQCGGDVVQKAWRGGKFWGCGNYPTCKFAIFDAIQETPCPKCKWPFLTVKSGAVLCANKDCGYKE
jgi:DNA topoisomerase I